MSAKRPVIHEGEVPQLDLSSWSLRVWGQVERPTEWSWDQLLALPQTERSADALCEKGRVRPSARWGGVAAREILSRIRTLPEATYALVHSYGEFSAGLPLSKLAGPDVLFAHTCDGQPLLPDHGWPVRLIVPGLGFEKWIKWVSGVEILNKPWPNSPHI